MRLPSPFARLTHRTAVAVATEVAEAVRSTAEATLAEVVEAVRAEVTAPIPVKASHRGRTATTVAVVTATAVVATAAYVWWKRRDHIESGSGEIEYPNETPAPPRPAPVATATPVVQPAADALDDCGAHSEGPKPSVAAANPSVVRPPVASGRFAMPGVRRFVLPTASRILP